MFKSFTRSVIFIFLALVATTAYAESICSQAQMENLVKVGTPAFANDVLTSQIQSNKVFVVGEIHFYTDLKPRLDLISEYRRLAGTNACVAFELAARPVGTEVSLATLKSGIESLEANEEFKKVPSRDAVISSLKQLYDYYFPMVDYVVKLGLKARSVDHKDHFDKSQTMEERNQAMAENISSLIKNGDCSSVLFFVGKAHLSRNLDSPTRVQDLIRGLGISTVTAHLQMTKESLPDGVRSWSICPFAAKIKLSDYAVISNKSLNNDPYLFPNLIGDLTKWKDFDFSLLAP